MLIWTDIETTGLDPKTDVLLELGIIVTDDNLEEVARKNWVINHRAFTFRSPYVAKMHANSGLLDECQAHESISIGTGATFSNFKISVFSFLHDLEEETGQKVIGSIMAGASVHFDREFLKVHGEGIVDYYHYRNLDVSTIGRLAETWRPDLKEKAPQKREIHRALPDLEDSIELLKFYRENWLT